MPSLMLVSGLGINANLHDCHVFSNVSRFYLYIFALESLSCMNVPTDFYDVCVMKQMKRFTADIEISF